MINQEPPSGYFKAGGFYYKDFIMERFLVFAFNKYVPEGGWKDFQGDFMTHEDAFTHCQNIRKDFSTIVDTHEGTTTNYEKSNL